MLKKLMSTIASLFEGEKELVINGFSFNLLLCLLATICSDVLMSGSWAFALMAGGVWQFLAYFTLCSVISLTFVPVTLFFYFLAVLAIWWIMGWKIEIPS